MEKTRKKEKQRWTRSEAKEEVSSKRKGEGEKEDDFVTLSGVLVFTDVSVPLFSCGDCEV